jgi:hypothetical protein
MTGGCPRRPFSVSAFTPKSLCQEAGPVLLKRAIGRTAEAWTPKANVRHVPMIRWCICAEQGIYVFEYYEVDDPLVPKDPTVAIGSPAKAEQSRVTRAFVGRVDALVIPDGVAHGDRVLVRRVLRSVVDARGSMAATRPCQ